MTDEMNYIPRRSVTAKSTLSTMTPIIKHVHENSLVSLAQDFAHRASAYHENYQSFSGSLLKNKSLLVPTRLALKRQRAALKDRSLQYEPIQSEVFQIELGNPDEALAQKNQDYRRTTTTPDYHRVKSTSSPIRGDTPHTAPTDISLMYREKPVPLHPVTGHFIVQYTEDHGGPSPCSYVLPRKSCRERTAPAYTFGSRCLTEKKGGARTAWQKQWFAHSNPFTTKVDFNRENVWPTPFHYPARPTLGIQSTKISFPAWSIATRLQNSPTLMPENNPSPDRYDTTTAFRKSTAKGIPVSIKSRIGGTKISNNPSIETPGPGAHDDSKFLINKQSSPKHSFGKHIPASLSQDPYVKVLPSMRT